MNVVMLLQERARWSSFGREDRVAEIDRQLAAMGVTRETAAPKRERAVRRAPERR